MQTYIKAIILVIVLLFMTTFGVKNDQPMRLHYHFNIQTFDIPLYALIYLSIAIGIVTGMLVGIFTRFDLKRMVNNLERENRKLKERAEEEKRGEGPPAPSPIEDQDID